MVDYEKLMDSVIKGEQERCINLIKQAFNENISPADILNKGLIPSMDIIGDKFRKNIIYVPEVLISARAMKSAMELLRPLMTQTGAKPIGTAVIGTIQGDLHDIGKNLVSMMWEGAGIIVIDLGINITPEKYINAIKEHNAQIIGMSALLTTTMVNFKMVNQALEKEGLRDKVKVICGGAPVNAKFAIEVSCDGYAPDAATAVQVAKYLLKVHNNPELFELSGGWVKNTE